jgi:hypothetical protein
VIDRQIAHGIEDDRLISPIDDLHQVFHNEQNKVRAFERIDDALDLNN